MTEDRVPDPADVRDRLEVVRSEIDALGVDPDDVQIVAVTKTRSVATVSAVVRAGLGDIGENYAQELRAKAEAIGGDEGPRWHAIGQLQSNKVRLIADHVALWQTVDRLKVGREIAKRAAGAAVLVQVNVSDEEQKGGCRPDEVAPLVDGLVGLDLAVQGLMTVATVGGGDRARREFEHLRRLVDDLGLSTCSMGMSGDYREAIEAGSTMLRLGTALVGPRDVLAPPGPTRDT